MREKHTYTLESIKGNLVDVINNEIYPAEIEIRDGKISQIIRLEEQFDKFILPGFIDSHIHIESTMLTPSEFSRIAVKNGLVSVVADPHEISNVLGLEGVEFMIENSKKVPFKFYFAAPSCVPATDFETSGANINSEDIKILMQKPEIVALGEMMYFQGVVAQDKEVMAKLSAAKIVEKPIDGHAPGILGADLKKYVDSGISTDHECSTREEALEKINLGMKILIREGSAAKDFDALSSLIDEYPDFCMFSSDDRHPTELLQGHINLLVKKSIALGYDKMNVLKCACVNPVKHYKLDVGLLQKGDSADFIQIDNFEDINVEKTVISGEVVYEDGNSLIPQNQPEYVNNFNSGEKLVSDFSIKHKGGKINVIEASDGSLLTKKLLIEPKVVDSEIVSDTDSDILKVAVINRYKDSKPAVAFIKGFGLKKGAIASSVAHDSHNIIVVGTSDDEITKAVNSLVQTKGGLCVVDGDEELILPLPIAGLMSDKDIYSVAKDYSKLEEKVNELGSVLSDAFMTMSFMTLLAIPDLKLSDKGLFDSKEFKFINLED